MYQQQSNVSGGMLKRHFTVIYSQLDDLKEKTARMESNFSEVALRMQELNRKFAQLENNSSKILEVEKKSQDLTTVVGELKRDITSLRARFESELLSLGDPFNSKVKPGPTTDALSSQQSSQTTEVHSPKPQEQTDTAQTPPEQAPSVQTPSTQEPTEPAKAEPPPAEVAPEEASESESDTKYEPSMKSLEEQLGLVPPSEDSANNQTQEGQGEDKKGEKKKHRFF